jgi:5-methylcytosine-specific restriction endonuclease McrA
VSASYDRTGGHWAPVARKDEKAWRLSIVLRDGFRCVYCRTKLDNAPPRVVQLDHLVVASQGGSHEPSNLVTACRSCNSARGDRPWQTFATAAARRRIRRLTVVRPNIELARAFLAGTVEAA